MELLERRRAARGGRQPARARPRGRRVARRRPARGLRADPRGLAPRDRPAPLRRAADRRHGPPRRRDRRDEDRRGQDPDRDARRLPQHARRRRRPRRHRQRLPGPPRRRMDDADLRGARGHRGLDPGGRRPRHPQAQIRLRRHLRDQLRVRLRLPARQHVAGARALRPARPPLRDRRRGRQHPDRRGAHAADHLRRPRAGGADLLHRRPPRQTDGRRAGQRQAEIARRVQGHLRGRLRLRVRREAQDRRADRARGQTGRGVPRRRQPLPGRARHPRQPPRPGAQGRVALRQGQGLRGGRRPGDDHRRVHRPHPRGPALVGGPAPGGRGQGGRRDRRGEPDAGDDHPAELLPPLRQALRDDRHGADRGDRVHEDLQSAGGRDPDQPGHGPGRPQRPDLQDQRGQVEGRPRGNLRPPRGRPADPGRDRLGRGLGDDLRRAEAPRRRARGAQRQARARRTRGRADRPGRVARAR